MVNYLSTPVGTTPQMVTKVGLRLPLPLMAPATATWALPFAAYYIFLQNRIVYHRLTTETYARGYASVSRSAISEGYADIA